MTDTAEATAPAADWPLPWLRSALALVPRDASLYRAALTHRSAGGANNERLEFLGDAVLNFVVAEGVFTRFPTADEGTLSRLRSRVVSAPPLAEVAAAIGVGAVLRLGSGELRSGGFRRESILADATEALIGATYLDGGFDVARALVLRLFGARMDALDPSLELKDPKTRLQELLQGRGLPLPVYTLERAEGEPHAQVFWVRCDVSLPAKPRVTIRGRDIAGASFSATCQGSSRRRAEQGAASAVLAQVEGMQGDPGS